MRGARWAMAAFAAIAAASCNKAGEPDRTGERAAPPTPPSVQVTKPAPAAPSPHGPADIAYDAPSSWPKSDKPAPMRKATYTIPHAEGDAEDGELSVSQAGGAVDQNIARWALQLGKKLEDVKRSERTVNGIKVTVVEIHGEYMAMAMPGAPTAAKKPGWVLLGAIVESSPLTFLKLTGPEKTVMAAQRDFDRLIDTVRAK